MNKIKVLSPHEAQKIAAGEIVERPAHVLKELLENAIDAGATQVSVFIKDAGKQCIRIVDDGCGMSYDDAVLCVASHATSKISSVDELSQITTYGFRGEALASVAAVSRLTITTRNKELDYGWQLRFERGTVSNAQRVAIECGTDLEVRDLFYNIPARKKFLKQDETEWNQLQQLVHAIALSHLNVTFKLFRDDKSVLHAPRAANLQDRVAQLWGVSTAQQFLAVNQGDEKEVRIQGVITSHQAWRYGKHQIFFFVNGRWVKDVELVKALLRGYNNVLPIGKFPAAVIMISIDPAVIDVNVHPKKEEVRFTKPQLVSNAVIQAVQATLRVETTKTISSESVRQIIVDNVSNESGWPRLANRPPAFHQLGNVFESSASGSRFEDNRGMDSKILVPASSVIPGKDLGSRAIPIPASSIFSGKLIGQILNTYLIVEQADGIVLVDQHAAHERILYERMKDRMVARESSLLIFPQMVALTVDELTALERFEELFLSFGIEGDRVGPQTLAIKAVPLGIAHVDLEELLHQAAALIIEEDHLDPDAISTKLYEHVHSHLACKRAVKAGDVLTHIQMERLLADLLTIEKPFICIHGRPTYWRLGQSELEKFFRR